MTESQGKAALALTALMAWVAPMNDIELNRRELTGDDALRFARESGMERASETRGLFLCGVGDLIRFARLVRAGWTPPAEGVEGMDGAQAAAKLREDTRQHGHCGICGKDTPHQHTSEEVVIFRNGVKRGTAGVRVPDGGQS